MAIKIPESINIPNRTRNITLQSKGTGGSMDWSLDNDQLSGNPEDNPLFVFMLKYLMAPMQKDLNNVADNFRFYLRPQLLEDAAENNAEMEVDAEEYKQHIKYAWREINEAIMYAGERKEKGGRGPQSGILYILSEQPWIEQKVIEPLIRRTQHRMSREGQGSKFADILDLEDDEGNIQDIGTTKQKKIFGYRTGKKAEELWAAADRKQPYWPILKLFKQLDDKGNYTTDAGKPEQIIELVETDTKTYGKGKSGQRTVVQIKEFIIHFDKLFKIFREENGMFPPTKQSATRAKEISDMSPKEYKQMLADEEQSALLEEAEKETMDIGKAKKKEKQKVWLGEKEEQVLQRPDLSDRQFLMSHGGFWQPKGVTQDDQMNLIRINLKILWNEKWPIESVEIKSVDWLIIRLARYGIITLDRAVKILEDHDLRGLKEFDFNAEEYELIKKALEGKTNLNEIERELKIDLDNYSRGKQLKEEGEEKRSRSKPIIHGAENTEWASRKLFPNIYKIQLKDIDLRAVANNVAEFKEVLHDAITPGREGVFTFTIGIDTKMAPIAKESFTLQSIGYETTTVVPYRDYIAQAYSESGSSKFMPSDYQEPRSTKAPRKKDFTNNEKYQAALDKYNKEIRGRTGREIEGGQVSWQGSNISEPQIFLHYLKKQLTKLGRMVKSNV